MKKEDTIYQRHPNIHPYERPVRRFQQRGGCSFLAKEFYYQQDAR